MLVFGFGAGHRSRRTGKDKRVSGGPFRSVVRDEGKGKGRKRL